MSIAFDAASSGFAVANSITISHTVSNKIPHPILCVLIAWRNITGGDGITGVTYNGVTMTRAVAYTGATQITTYIYYLLNPTVGSAQNIVVSTTSAQNTCVMGLSYGGVHKIGASNANGNGGDTVCQATVTNSFHKSIVVFLGGLRHRTATFTWDANVTQRVSPFGGGGNNITGCEGTAGEWSNLFAGTATTAGGTWSDSNPEAWAALELVEMRVRMVT